MAFAHSVRSEQLPLLAAAAVCIALGMALWLEFEYRDAEASVRHTIAAQQSLLSISSSAHKADDAGIRFVLTGVDSFRADFDTAVATVQIEIGVLQDLVADNLEQTGLVARLRQNVSERLALISVPMSSRQNQGSAPPAFGSEIGAGSTAMNAVSATIDLLYANESTLLLTRLADVNRLLLAGWIADAITVAGIAAAMVAWIGRERFDGRALLRLSAESEKGQSQIRQMQKIETIGQLTGGLAHDLNNMLAVIISALNLTQKRLAAGDIKVERFVDSALDGATRAATLTSRLMAFSRQAPLNPEALDANKLIRRMSELMQRTLGETIQHQSVLNAGLWYTNADPIELENAILNLAINARDAMPKGGKLSIETSNSRFDDTYAAQNDVPNGDYVLIAVTDTGEGMSPDTVAKAFDPFFTTKGVGKGTGLGLSQVFGFVKQSHGHVQIYSEPGLGTTVKIYLPRLNDVDPQQDIVTAKVEAWPNLSRDHSGDLILVVEDDARVREMTVAALRELGYMVLDANGATRALEQLDAHPTITMLFTDIVMPDVNGRQLAAEVLKRRPDIKVLYTTGFTRDAIVHSGKLDAGLNFIAKPFTLVQLDAKMNFVLAGTVPA